MDNNTVWRVKASHHEQKRHFDIATFDNEQDARNLVSTIDEMIDMVIAESDLEYMDCSPFDIYIVDETRDRRHPK